MSNKQINQDLPEYLAYQIMDTICRLREIAPDHMLVKALEGYLLRTKPEEDAQLSLDLDGG